MDIISIAHPFLTALSDQYDETCHLATLSGTNIVYIGKAESMKTLQLGTRPGAVMPAYCSALGKALLAQLPKSKLDELVGGIVFERFTPNTLGSPEELLEELKMVRAEGCAYDNAEREPGLFCVAAPIFDSQSECVAAVSLSVLHSKSETVGREKLKTSVMNTAHDISKALGYMG